MGKLSPFLILIRDFFPECFRCIGYLIKYAEHFQKLMLRPTLEKFMHEFCANLVLISLLCQGGVLFLATHENQANYSSGRIQHEKNIVPFLVSAIPVVVNVLFRRQAKTLHPRDIPTYTDAVIKDRFLSLS